MMMKRCLIRLLSTIVVLGFSGVLKECRAQNDFDFLSPLILVHPRPISVHITRGNESVEIMCLAIGDNVTYAWERQNSSVPNKAVGQDTHVLTLPELRLSDSGNYRCRVSNEHGATFSNYAYVNVTESLQATVEPHNLTVEITTSVSLSCVVDGFRVSNLSYLWEVTQIREGAEASQLHNATSLHLLLQNVTTSTACRCIVTNSRGTTAVSAFSYITVVVHPPTIIDHPVSKGVELQNSNSSVNMSFSCASTGNVSNFQWERLQEALPVNSQGETTDTLTVYDVQPKDSGYYRCSVSNNSGTVYSNYATLNITVRLPVITTAYVNQSLYNIGDRAVFVCRGEGYGRLWFKWERQDGNISSSAIIDMNNGTLVIPSLLISDKGNYRCIVCDEWNGTVYSEFVHLNVSERPLVFIANSPLLVQQNSNASLSCITIDGFVNTTFLWSRVDGEPLSNRVDGDDSRILTIVGVTEEDEGEYMCIASTEAQAIATTVILTVYGIPRLEQLQTQYVFEESEQLFLSCTVQNDPDSPDPLEITWYKGDNQLSNGQDGRYVITYINGINNIVIALLMISRVQKDDAGQYSCRVNPGNISTETTVVINYEPEIMAFQLLPSNNIMVGQAVQILCRACANPLPSITMSRDSAVIFTRKNRVAAYKIQRVSADDNGTVFSCEATNSVGTAIEHVTLTVTGIPDVMPSTTMTVSPVSSTVINHSIAPSTISPSAPPVTATSIYTTPTPRPPTIPVNIEQISRGLTTLQVQWTASQDHMTFHVRLYCIASCDDVMRNFTTVDPLLTVYGLRPNQTYAIQVAAVTSDGVLTGYSEPIQVSTVTSGAASVKEVVVTKRRLREVVLQWTIDEDLSQDLLQLHSSQDVVMLNANTITLAVSAEESSVTITAVYRLNGTNVTWSSEPVAVTLQPFVPDSDNSVLFQLQLVSETNCNEWKAELGVMTATIVNEISRHCNCPLSTVDTFSTDILCSNSGDVIYRGGLGASTQLGIEVIQVVLKEWIAQTSMLIVNESQLQVDHDCPLVLSSFDDPICDSTSADTPVPPDSSDNSIIPILVGVICGVIIGAVLITGAIIILVTKCRGKTDQIRPGGNSPVYQSPSTTQTRSARRKAQTSEEATYSEVFNNAPPCPIQPCPAYQASIHIDHDYADIDDENNTTNVSAHVFAEHPGAVQSSTNHSHNELELSVLSSSSNGNDYSEPLTLSQRLDSKASRLLHPAQMASNSCSGYLEPISHEAASNNSRLDNQDTRGSQTLSSHQQQVPVGYLEPVNQSQQNANQQSDYRSNIDNTTNLYSEHDYEMAETSYLA